MYILGEPTFAVARSTYLEQVRRIGLAAPPDHAKQNAELAASATSTNHESREAAPARYGTWYMRGEFSEFLQAIKQALSLLQEGGHPVGATDAILTFESFEVHSGAVTLYVGLHPSNQQVLLQVGNNAHLSASERRQFIEEVALAQEISAHLRVARILGGGFTSLGYPFVMQLFDEGAVPTIAPLSSAEIVDVGRKLADALDYAHNMGASFGKIEKSNILSSMTGDPILSFPYLPILTPPGNDTTAGARDVYHLCSALLSLFPHSQENQEAADHRGAWLESQVRELLGSGLHQDPLQRPSAAALRESFYGLMRTAAGTWDNAEISRRIRIPGSDGSFAAEILVHTGDLFGEPSDIVVSFSDTFDTDTDMTTNPGRVVISPSSLQGQLVNRLYDGDIDALNRELNDALTSVPISRIESRTKKRLGKLERYEIGTIAVLEHSGRNIFAVAVSRMGNDLIARSSYEFLNQSLQNLWAEIRRRGTTSVAMPIIGSGLARVDISPYNLYDLISTSFREHTQVMRICSELRITIHSSDRETAQRIDAAISAHTLQRERNS